ncbi:MAG: hypothetical protein JWO02_2311 [Solirubrobacterales bacterium]|nr:hypothetical protein [Solirubrobacterales bacterium]
MFTSIRSSQRPATPITRVTAALPALPHALPHPHRKRRSHVGATAIVSAVAALAAVLVATAAVFHDKLASIVSRGDAGEDQAPDAGEE